MDTKQSERIRRLAVGAHDSVVAQHVIDLSSRRTLRKRHARNSAQTDREKKLKKVQCSHREIVERLEALREAHRHICRVVSAEVEATTVRRETAARQTAHKMAGVPVHPPLMSDTNCTYCAALGM